MSRDDNIEIDWHDVKEEGGVKYIDCEWITPDPRPAPSPAPSPRKMHDLAAALQAALADPAKLQKLTALLSEPTEKKVVIDTPPQPPSSTEIPAPQQPVAPPPVRRRRVHGALY
jgi:hypothetical protein